MYCINLERDCLELFEYVFLIKLNLNQKIIINSKIKFDVVDQEELYKKFLIPRQHRIDLNKVYFELEYNIEDGNYYLSNINFTEKSQKVSNFYEVNNFQQLNSLISKEFKKITLD